MSEQRTNEQHVNAGIWSVEWAMPNRSTFSIPPISRFVHRWTAGKQIVIDPMCGDSELGTHRNDLRMSDGIDAAAYCKQFPDCFADVVIFDPPYSPRQIKECYESIGLDPTQADTQNAALYYRVRKELHRLLKPGGIALSFGWQSGGFGRRYTTEEILLVQHGGAHNDTICVAQSKPA